MASATARATCASHWRKRRKGRSTMALEKILLFCYHYDPKAGAYVWFALNIMRGGGALTVFLIAFFHLADVPLGA